MMVIISSILRTVDRDDQSAPFSDIQETRIAISHSGHMISKITNGLLTFNVKLTLKLTGIDASKFDDSNHLCKLFCLV
jgi:hypothetical protein